jgi:predicted CoA-binding protein
MTDDHTLTDTALRDILTRTRVVAVVGFSPDPARPSHDVARFLQRAGYRVIPVNPGHAGAVMLGETVVARLEDIPPEAGVDMVDIFRRSDHVLPIVETALRVLPSLRTVWMQIGVDNPEAAALARARGVDVVVNRCPKIDHPRVMG